jgi:hypothetical protein
MKVRYFEELIYLLVGILMQTSSKLDDPEIVLATTLQVLTELLTRKFQAPRPYID